MAEADKVQASLMGQAPDGTMRNLLCRPDGTLAVYTGQAVQTKPKGAYRLISGLVPEAAGSLFVADKDYAEIRISLCDAYNYNDESVALYLLPVGASVADQYMIRAINTQLSGGQSTVVSGFGMKKGQALFASCSRPGAVAFTVFGVEE